VDIERNRQLIIDCQADGVPKPTVIWKKATGQCLEYNTNIITNYYILARIYNFGFFNFRLQNFFPPAVLPYCHLSETYTEV